MSHHPLDAKPLSSSIGWLLSILFWTALGLAAGLVALLVLAPRWLQYEQLRVRYTENARELKFLEREAIHLDRVVNALKTDPEYVARVAASELNEVPPGGVRIRLNSSLEYDSRLSLPIVRPASDKPTFAESRSAEPLWYMPLLELTAESGPVRSRLTLVAVLLSGLAFLCLNEVFFSGGLRSSLRTCAAGFGRRYAVDSNQDTLKSVSR